MGLPEEFEVEEYPEASSAYRVWRGCHVLCCHLAQLATGPEPRVVRPGCKVLELGSGSGLGGIVCAHLGAHVTLTDIDEDVLKFTKQNVAKNPVPEGAPGSMCCAE